MGYLYSWGASVVMIGALMKLEHFHLSSYFLRPVFMSIYSVTKNIDFLICLKALVSYISGLV